MDTINLAPFNHTIYSRQSFHVVMMTESGEELKLVGGGEPVRGLGKGSNPDDGGF